MVSKTDRDREIYEGRIKARRDRAAEQHAIEMIAQIRFRQRLLKRAVPSFDELWVMRFEELDRLEAELEQAMQP